MNESAPQQGGAMIEAFAPATREAWLARRRSLVGMSEVPALFGVHPHGMTPFELYALKRGEYEPRFGGGATVVEANSIHLSPMDRGLLFEEPAIQCVRWMRPEWAIKHNPMPGGQMFIDSAWGIAATPDAFILEPGGMRSCLQIKSVAYTVFQEKWRGADGEVELPLGVAVQAMGDAALSGCGRAYACVIVSHWTVDVYLFEVPLKPRHMQHARTLVADFWRRVRANDPYPPDFAKDGEVLAQVYRDDDGGTISLPDTPRLRKLMGDHEELAMAERAARAARAKRGIVDNEIKHVLGNAACGVLPDGTTIEARTVHNGGTVIQPFTYRPVKIKAFGSGKRRKPPVNFDGPF